MAAERRATRLTVPLERLRELMADLRHEGVSMRQIAGEAGVGVTTVWQFLRGSTPHPGTHDKLANWYLRRAASSDAAAIGRTDAFARLTPGLGPKQRDAVIGEIARQYVSMFGAVPSWVDELRPPAD